MEYLNLVYLFFGGAFLANGVPHLVMGMTGRKFPTPFAKPPGRGESSAMVNVIWGIANFFAAFLFLAVLGVFEAHSLILNVCVWAGFIVSAVQLGRHFGHLYGGSD